MDSGDHLGNLFDEEEQDSFDDPIPGTKKTEEDNEGSQYESQDSFDDPQHDLDLEEEDFNILTIEKVPMDTLKSRIVRVLSEVIYRGERAAVALFDVANKIVYQSTMLDGKRNTVIGTLTHGLTCVILDKRERAERMDQTEKVIMMFITKLAIKNKSLKSSDLLFQLILLVDRLYSHPDSSSRTRVTHLIACLVEEANRYAEVIREHGDDVFLFTDETPNEGEEVIPSGVKKRWMGKLAKSLLDKAPQVRSRAVIALSLWDHDEVCQMTEDDKLTVNDLLWKSIHDVDESVRINAARRIHIVEEKEIDECIDYVERSKDVRVRQEIVNRLASDVHLNSYTDKQRFRLVNLLNESDSVRVQNVIHQRLVESWMRMAGEEVVSPSAFPTADFSLQIPKEFPSIIFEYLSPFEDPNAVYIFMKFSTIRYIRLVTGKQLGDMDVEEFMKACLRMGNSECECVGLMRRTTLRIVSEEDDPEKEELRRTFLRIFVTRCFVDVIFDAAKGRLDMDYIRDRALTFFLPDVVDFVDHLKTFCSIYFKEEEDSNNGCRELLFYNIIHLINKSVKYGNVSDDRNIYKEALMELLETSSLVFSDESISTMVTTCLDLCKNRKETENMCNWVCATASQLMLHGSQGNSEPTLDGNSNIEKPPATDRMYLRIANMLLSTCEHEDVEEPTEAMTDLFKSIIPSLLGNENKAIKKVGLELIGFATSIDFTNCEPYIKLTQLLIETDDEVLKSTGIHTVVRVVKSHGFPETAKAIFHEEYEDEEDCQEALAKLFEKSMVSLQGNALYPAVQDVLSMLSYGRYAWPKMYCALLLTVFQKSNQTLPFVKMFKTYCKKAVRSDFTRMNLLLGFNRSIEIISTSSEYDASWNLVDMTELMCETISCVQTIGDEVDDASNKKTVQKEKYLEVEFAYKMIDKAVNMPSAWFIRHVFTAMATSLRLESVPIETLDELHGKLVDSFKIIRPNSDKTTQIAYKRFLTQCEKVISLHETMKRLKSGVDLKKVKKELDDSFEAASSSSSRWFGRKKKQNKIVRDDGDNADGSDDSFEYFPQSTRTRKRVTIATEIVPPKKAKVPTEEQINLDDSFEL